MTPHPDKAEFDRLFPYVRQLQVLASKHGIGDIFQDNGGKLLQILLITNLRAMRNREGNDAQDDCGNEYELKSVNSLLTKSFSTHHHLNPVIIRKYRQVVWFFAIYESIELKAIYKMTPDLLEPYFDKWEKQWHEKGGRDINNPKINLKFVLNNGELFYAAEN